MKAKTKFETALSHVSHHHEIVSAIMKLTPGGLKSLATAAKVRAKIVEKAGKKQAKAILKAGTMGAPACKFAQKHGVSEDLMTGTDAVCKASKKLSKRLPKAA